MVTHPRAEELISALSADGIQARGYYRTPLHRQPAMQEFAGALPVSLPVTERLSAENVALPMSAVLSAEAADHVVATIAAHADH